MSKRPTKAATGLSEADWKLILEPVMLYMHRYGVAEINIARKGEGFMLGMNMLPKPMRKPKRIRTTERNPQSP